MIYKYYSKMRPVSLGTYPKKGLIAFENFEKRAFVAEIDREAWAVLYYSRILSQKEVTDYEFAEGFLEE